MKLFKKFLWILGTLAVLCVAAVVFLWLYLPRADFGFARESNAPAHRAALLDAAAAHLGVEEDSDAHHSIIDAYNGHEPLAQGYEVQYDDDWCATFVSYCAIRAELTDIIPTECGCERQIALWQELERWEEDDTYLPLPGDIIYYDWDVRTLGDSTGWSDHVGIVVGTHGPFIKVIEGNKDDAVGYRYIIRWDPRIRGYGLLEPSEDQWIGNLNLIVATDLPSSPSVQDKFFYAYDLDGNLCKVWKPKGADLPSYDATDCLTEDMHIYVTVDSRKRIDSRKSDDAERAPVYEIHASLIQDGYTPTPGGEITGGGRWFLATVADVGNNKLQVIPRDDIHPASLSVSTKRADEFAIGDTVLVAYDESIQDNEINSPYDVIGNERHVFTYASPTLGMALYDIDDDGQNELCGLGYGPTSGLFTFEVTVWEEGKVEHFGCFCTKFYCLSFVEEAPGIVRIQGITQGDNPVTHYFDMTASDGIVQLTQDGEPLTFWGPVK